jgi:hypothetical protein
MKKKTITNEKGFVALMAAIIISLVLLTMAVEEGAVGFHSRFTILSTEAKEQSSALAEGCVQQALAALAANPNYEGNATTTFSFGTCYVFPITPNTPSAGLATIKTQAQVRGSYTNLVITLNLHDVHVGAPISSPPPSPDLRITTDSWNEVATQE